MFTPIYELCLLLQIWLKSLSTLLRELKARSMKFSSSNDRAIRWNYSDKTVRSAKKLKLYIRDNSMIVLKIHIINKEIGG